LFQAKLEKKYYFANIAHYFETPISLFTSLANEQALKVLNFSHLTNQEPGRKKRVSNYLIRGVHFMYNLRFVQEKFLPILTK
jgi:hypothetical protein